MELILASASPRRKELLTNAGFKFSIIPAEIDETFISGISAYENVKRVSNLKALEIFKNYPNSIVLASDTIVVYDDVVYGKPKDEADAYKMLRLFSGKTHYVLSGVSIVSKDKVDNFVIESKVTFKDLTDEDIYNYINSGEPYGKAGSYAIQGLGGNLVLKYEGELENIIGLPIKEIIPILKGYGL